MCGRISRTSPRDAIANEFGVTRFAEVRWEPRYNVAPSQIVETIISVDGEKRLGPMRWGFVSPTAKEPKLAPINARAETLSTSPMFRDACRRHRCLVVADGFYEWRKNDGRRRTPFFICLKSGRPFGFAGIWSLKHGEKEARLATCAIATCPPNELMAKIHDRMPVIVPVGVRDRWLDPTANEAELRGLLVPLPAEELESYEVSSFVNSPGNDSPECLQPVVAGLEDEVRQRLLLTPTSRVGRGS
jgi:putative SOS response-associated peptidase YedK